MSKFHTKEHLYVASVTLMVSDIKRSLDFYQHTIGLTLLSHDKTTYHLGVKDKILVSLIDNPQALPKSRTTGLYHFAILLPDRAYLGQILKHFLTHQIKLTGASDHGVSEAIYLNDPDGNGIEIYADRSMNDWPKDFDGSIQMFTEAMDAHEVIAAGYDQPFTKIPEATVMGHLHLHVASLEKATQFFIDLLGFQKVIFYGDSALFISDRGYHHHIGLNTWNGQNVPNNPLNAVGLKRYDLSVPYIIYEKLTNHIKVIYPLETISDHESRFKDINDVWVHLIKV